MSWLWLVSAAALLGVVLNIKRNAMCFGLCSEGPNVCIMPDNVWLRGVKAEDVPAIIDAYVKP